MRLTLGSIITLAFLAACGSGSEAPALPPAAAPTAPGVPIAPVVPTAAPAPAAVMPTVVLTPEQTAKAAEVAASLGDRVTFPTPITADKSLAPVFLYLAATSPDERVVVASFKALNGCWAIVPSLAARGYTMIDDTFVGVIRARLRDPRPRVQAAAIEGGGAAFRRGNTHEGLLDSYLALAAPGTSPQLRYAVMDAVWQSNEVFKTPERAALFVSSLDAPEPWLVSTALFRLDGNVPRDAVWGTALSQKYLALTRHADPGVRGRAAQNLAGMLARLPATDAFRQSSTARLVEMMGDENPYTKSEAINAQGTLGNVAAIPAIATHLTDSTSNTYDIRGWQALDGTAGTKHHDGSAWSQVRDSALYAIKNLSRTVDRDNRFDYTITGGTSARDLDAAATAAQTWVQAHQAAFAAH